MKNPEVDVIQLLNDLAEKDKLIRDYRTRLMQVCAEKEALQKVLDEMKVYNKEIKDTLKSLKTDMGITIHEGSPMMCHHANENPMKCDCPINCYCQTHTCKDRIFKSEEKS